MDKEKWDYFYSQTLGMKCAIHNEKDYMYCEDGTIYSAGEVDYIENDLPDYWHITKKHHAIKKMFDGIIIK